MKSAIVLLTATSLLGGLLVWGASPDADPGTFAAAGAGKASGQQVVHQYGRLPLSFEANQGQTDSQVKFLSRGRGYTLYLTSSQAVLVLQKLDNAENEPGDPAVLGMKLVGADPRPAVEGREALPGKSHYFLGNDPAKWRTNVPHFARVRYQEVYPGVDLEFYGNQQRLEYDFIVSPGADPAAITLAFEGAQRLEVDGQGDLLVELGDGEVRFRKPYVYQEAEGQRQEIAGRFMLRGENHVGFKVGAYDATQPLVIDPVLVYSTYLGGSGGDSSERIAVDATGNAYIVGSTDSTDFPTASPFQGTYGGGGVDVFLAKLNAAGSALVYSTYLGGSGGDSGAGIVVDTAGNAYVTGDTNSTNFPTASPLQALFGGGFNDAFVAKLNPSGSALVYSTYLGGSSSDSGKRIAVDAAGNAYIVGETESTNFPTASPFQGTFAGGSGDVFAAKLNAAGSALVYSSYLGGSGYDSGVGIVVDSASNAYVCGLTDSTNFPTASPFQAAFGGGYGDGFAAKLNAAGSALVYSTYLGGADVDVAADIAVDAAGNAYVSGYTYSTNFPTASPFQAAFGGTVDAFVTKFDSSGLALVYSTYLGGADSDNAVAITVDGAGNAYLTGGTYSTNFPTKEPLQAANGGSRDAFVAQLEPGGSSLAFSTYLGGTGDDFGVGIGVDSLGNSYVIGRTSSTNFPTANPLQATNAGNGDAFIAKIGAAAAGALFGVTACCPNQFVGIDPDTGELTVLGSVGGTSDRFAGGAVAVDASSHRFFVVERSPAGLVSIDTTSGASTEKALSQDLIALGFHATAGTLFGVTACCPNQFVSIDVATGALTVLGSVGTASDRFAATAAVDSGNNRFFLAKREAPRLVIIDTTTGGTTEKALSQEVIFLGFESSSSTLFGVTACCPNQFVSIDVGTGALTVRGSVGTAADRFAVAVAIDPTSNWCFLAKRASPRLVIIDTTTGAATEKALGQEIILLGLE